MRHGIADNQNEHLSEQGRLGVEQMVSKIKKKVESFDLIITSLKTRAIETAILVAKEVGYEVDNIERTSLVNPNGNISSVRDDLINRASNEKVCIVGHLPSLPFLVSTLISEGREFVLDMNFHNACFGRIDIDFQKEEPGNLKYFLQVD